MRSRRLCLLAGVEWSPTKAKRAAPSDKRIKKFSNTAIPASPDTDTSPVLGPRRRPRVLVDAKPRCVDSRVRGCARPASEGSLSPVLGPRRRPRVLVDAKPRCVDSRVRGCARPASEGSLSPVLGPRRRPRVLVDAKPQCVDSRGRGCARPASEGSLDESPSRPDGIKYGVPSIKPSPDWDQTARDQAEAGKLSFPGLRPGRSAGQR